MCGICGKLSFREQPISLDLLKKMNQVIAHRGPDDDGFYNKGPVGLAHRRLSIIDLDTGKQPISNEDGTVWIIFNGEIYNHLQLREELEQQGHHFRTRTDTETIVHLYEEKGVRCVESLRGMFAFAIWDETKQRLLLARDRLGQKPLVYYHDEQQLLFASEIKSILQDPQVAREVNLEAIHSYLTYLYIPSPLTAFRGISKLPPAHYLVVENNQVTIERYWHLSFQPKNTASFGQCQEELWQILHEATQMRLMSDVPLGAFLSGGIDSSAVVGIMSQIMNRPVKTFSIGYANNWYNELPYAKIVAKKFATEHTEFTVQPNAMEVLPKLIWHYNEPFADASSIPTYYVSKLAREYVTVALSGDAGDENFAGYDRYFTSKLVEFYQKIPRWWREKIIVSLVEALPNLRFHHNIIGQLKVFIKGASLEQSKRFAHRNSVFTREFKNLLYSQTMAEKSSQWEPAALLEQAFLQADAPGLIDKLLAVDLQYYLCDDILVKVDIASMANSLEVRSPFLDHKLVEFAARLPEKYKLFGRSKKHILKKTLQGILPQQLIHRRKMGFHVPTSHWFRNELKSYLYEVLLDPTTLKRGYFQEKYLRQLLDEHIQGRQNHDLRIWALLNLELWHRMFIDQVADL